MWGIVWRGVAIVFLAFMMTVLLRFTFFAIATQSGYWVERQMSCKDGILISQAPWYLRYGELDKSHQCYLPQNLILRADRTGQ